VNGPRDPERTPGPAVAVAVEPEPATERAEAREAPGRPAPPGPAPAGDDRPRGRRRTAGVVAGLTAVLALPLLVAAAALRSPRWFPLLDLAQTEMRVRDVGTGHTPLIGLIGRMTAYGHDGSHPGPLSFLSLAPAYRLLGSSGWSLLAGVVVLNTVAIALILWIAVRRGGATLALGLAAVVAVLLSTYGTHVLTEPWNPYMPVMWWLLTLVAVWAVLCDDLPMLPIAVFAGSFCMQTHVSYLGLVGGLAGLGAVALVVRAVMVRHDRAALRRLAGWGGLSAALALVLWLPPLLDQLRHDPGNMAIIVHYFRFPGTEPLGLSRGGELFAVHLNLWRFLAGDQATSGSVLPAVLLVVAWAGAALATWWLRPASAEGAAARRTLGRLHVLVGVVLVLGLVSAGRILGEIWFYLVLWAWAITALIVLAIGWTVVQLVAARPGGGSRRLARVVPVVAGVVLVAWTAQFAASATGAEVAKPRVSADVGAVTGPTVDALDAGDVPGGGPDGRYLVTWTDGVNLGSQGWGLLDELERAGFDVGVIEAHAVGATPHRYLPTAEATAEVHVSVGPDIDVWRARADATEVAYVDSRSPAEKAELDRLVGRVAGALRAAGQDDLVPRLDAFPFGVYLDPGLPPAERGRVQRIIDIGQPVAVFVAPAGGS
jgi:hypothetical protein